jgi:hypothetical protein
MTFYALGYIHRAGPQLVFFPISFLSYTWIVANVARIGVKELGKMSVKWKLGQGHKVTGVVTASLSIHLCRPGPPTVSILK